jgi:hypothetical protein
VTETERATLLGLTRMLPPEPHEGWRGYRDAEVAHMAATQLPTTATTSTHARATELVRELLLMAQRRALEAFSFYLKNNELPSAEATHKRLIAIEATLAELKEN